MHSFPQFTRGTLWREFAWVGAIIFEGNFVVRGQLSRGQFSLGAIIQGAIIQEAIVRRPIIWGGGNCPDTMNLYYTNLYNSDK